jgi:uncharacterized protein (DUF2062 family)
VVFKQPANGRTGYRYCRRCYQQQPWRPNPGRRAAAGFAAGVFQGLLGLVFFAIALAVGFLAILLDVLFRL